MLIEDIGQRLSHKPFEWMSWWWGIKWGTFINIHPQLTKETPLWSREDSSLKHVRLFKLPPNELQAEIARYWEKPLWRRWLSRLFTPIASKIAVWSYYQQCLSFKAVRKKYSVVESRLMVYEPEQGIVALLISELKRDNLALESRLERHSGNAEWMQKNLGLILAQHEAKRYQFFLKLLDNYLKNLPEECDQESVQKKLTAGYQELGKMLRNYVQHWCQPHINQQESPQSAEENPNRELVHVGPAEVSPRAVTSISDTDLNSSMSSINEWLALKREAIEAMLKEKPSSYETIQSFLEQSLTSLQSLIEPQLSAYESVVNEVRYKRVNYKEALQWSESLQNRLNYFFRRSGLLFHPDTSDGDKNLCIIKTKLFKEFQQFTINSHEKLSQGLRTLKRCIPQWQIDLDNRLKKAEQDEIKFKTQLDQSYTEITAQHAEIRAQHAKIRAQHAKIKTQHTEIKEEQAEIKETLNKILTLLNSRAARNLATEEQEQPLERAKPSPRP